MANEKAEKKAKSKLSPENRQRLIVGAILLGGAGGYYYFVGRRAYNADVRRICSEEARSETTIVNSRILVETNARKAMTSGDGVELIDRLKSAPPDSAARQLRVAADKAGVDDCPAAKGYETLSKRTGLFLAADRMCRRLDPTTLAKLPQPKRFAALREWTHSNVDDPSLDEMLASLDTGTLAERVTKMRTSLSDLGIHDCGLLPGLASLIDPVVGPNALIASVGLQTDDRETALAAALREKTPAFRDCYAQGLKVNSSINGRVTMKLRISETGAIDFAAVQADSPMQSPPVNACLVDLVKSVHGVAAPQASPGGMSILFWVAQ